MKKLERELGSLIHEGSVKDIYKSSLKEELIFLFSDRYSVFDWGEMPDALEGKGASLAKMGAFFFNFLGKNESWRNWRPTFKLATHEETILKRLQKEGLKHHFLGQAEGHDHSLVVSQVKVPSLSFDRGHYDYSPYENNPENILVPLEVIFRFGVPDGSSLLERVHDSEYRRVLGLSKTPVVGEWLSRPIIEYSTKLEATDRYLDYQEAQRISGLNDGEFADLHAHTNILAMRLFDFFKSKGLELWDGKVEWAFGESNDGKRDFVLVDSIGPDELRLGYKGMKLSKEFLRGFYRQGPWLEKVKEAKERAKNLGQKEWKGFVLDSFGNPPHLSQAYYQAAILLYKTLENVLTQDHTESTLHEAWKLLLEAMEKTTPQVSESQL